jgi:hypothetical protein
MKGYYLMGFDNLQAAIDLSHQGSTSVTALQWPLMSLVN